MERPPPPVLGGHGGVEPAPCTELASELSLLLVLVARELGGVGVVGQARSVGVEPRADLRAEGFLLRRPGEFEVHVGMLAGFRAYRRLPLSFGGVQTPPARYRALPSPLLWGGGGTGSPRTLPPSPQPFPSGGGGEIPAFAGMTEPSPRRWRGDPPRSCGEGGTAHHEPFRPLPSPSLQGEGARFLPSQE